MSEPQTSSARHAPAVRSGMVADAIVAQLAPRSVLVAACAEGQLVAALRERGVEASGFDPSSDPAAAAPEAGAPYVWGASLTDAIDNRYDLVVWIEGVWDLDPADGPAVVANLARASDRVLFSPTPPSRDDGMPHVPAPERWSQLFAVHGLLRDFRHVPAYVSPWAVLYRRHDLSLPDLVLDYDRALAQLRAEVAELQGAVTDARRHGAGGTQAGTARLLAEYEESRKEMLRLRDLVVGREAELGTARGRIEDLTAQLQRFQRYANLEGRLGTMLRSASRRGARGARASLRALRRRKA